MYHWKNTSLHSALFGFKTRDKRRDHLTDEQRFQTLENALNKVISSVERERAGLQNRYERATNGAASLATAEENGEAPDGANEQIDELTNEIIAYQRRMKRLSRLSQGLLALNENLYRLDEQDGA